MFTVREILKITDDLFVRDHGHILYSRPSDSSLFLKAIYDLEYKTKGVLYFGDEIVYEGICCFKLKKDKDKSPLLIFKIENRNLGHIHIQKRVEIEVPSELESKS